MYQKEFLEDLLLDNDVFGNPKQSFTSLAAGGDDDEISLLEDFGEDDSVEDPFAFGTESIMKDIMEDEVYQRQNSRCQKN